MYKATSNTFLARYCDVRLRIRVRVGMRSFISKAIALARAAVRQKMAHALKADLVAWLSKARGIYKHRLACSSRRAALAAAIHAMCEPGDRGTARQAFGSRWLLYTIALARLGAYSGRCVDKVD